MTLDDVERKAADYQKLAEKHWDLDAAYLKELLAKATDPDERHALVVAINKVTDRVKSLYRDATARLKNRFYVTLVVLVALVFAAFSNCRDAMEVEGMRESCLCHRTRSPDWRALPEGLERLDRHQDRSHSSRPHQRHLDLHGPLRDSAIPGTRPWVNRMPLRKRV